MSRAQPREHADDPESAVGMAIEVATTICVTLTPSATHGTMTSLLGGVPSIPTITVALPILSRVEWRWFWPWSLHARDLRLEQGPVRRRNADRITRTDLSRLQEAVTQCRHRQQ